MSVDLDSHLVRPLADLQVYVEQIINLQTQDLVTCCRDLSFFRSHLQQHRRANARQDAVLGLNSVQANWNWALPIVDTEEDVREEFFKAITVLLERHSEGVVRTRIFSLLLELSAIELAPPTSQAPAATLELAASNNHINTEEPNKKKDSKSKTSSESNSKQSSKQTSALPSTSTSRRTSITGEGIKAVFNVAVAAAQSGPLTPAASAASPPEMSFGHHALRTLRDILPNVIGVRPIFLRCVEDPFVEVLNSMSMAHLISIFPLLIDIFGDPAWSTMCVTDPHALNIYTLLSKFIPCLRDIFRVLVEQVSEPDGLNRPESHQLVWAMQQCGQLITLICQSEFSAHVCHGTDAEFSHLLFNHYETFRRLDSDERWSIDGFTFYRMIGRLCRGSSAAAAYLVGDHPKQPSSAFFMSLLAYFRNITDRPGEIDKSTSEPFTAAVVYCIASMCSRSKKACDYILDRKEGMKTSRDYHSKLWKLAEHYEHPDTLSSAMDALVLLTKNEHLKLFRQSMEDIKVCDLSAQIHQMFQKLFRVAHPKKGHRDALISSIQLITHYTKPANLGLKVFHQSSGKCNDLLFGLLIHKLSVIDDEVKLAAADCLCHTSLNLIGKKEVSTLVNLISSVPQSMSPAMHACTTRLLYLIARIALDERNDEEKEDEDEDENAEKCGEIFRSSYGSETFSVFFNHLSSRIVNDSSPLLLDFASVHYQLGIMKVLMSAWKRVELRSPCESRSAFDVMSKALKAEQSALKWCRERYARLIREGCCVDCEELLNKNSLIAPSKLGVGVGNESNKIALASSTGRTPSTIRCARCDGNDQNGNSILQQTYTPLYLEQTWIGSDIRAILHSLEFLSDVDLVAFRVFHQLSNILEGSGYHSCVDRLSAHYEFDEWNDDLPGRSVWECQVTERRDWAKYQRKLKQQEAESLEITPAQASDAAQFAFLQHSFYHRMYNIPVKDSVKNTWKAHWESRLERASLDERFVFCVIRHPDRGILGFCAGGPIEQAEQAWIEGANDGGAPYCQCYGLYVSTQLSTNEIKSYQYRLLSHFSSRMYELGFHSCFTRVHKCERMIYACAQYVDESATSSKTRFNKDNLTSSDVSKYTGAGSPFDKDKEFLYRWQLHENVWVRNPHHEEFMSADGIKIMLGFVIKDSIKTPMVFDSQIRLKMEEFGMELEEKFHKAAEQTNQTPAADGKPTNNPVNNTTDSSLVSSTNNSSSLDSFEYGDLSALPAIQYINGLLQNSSGNNPSLLTSVAPSTSFPFSSYDPSLPSLLHARLRASASECNRSVPSPWSASLLGSVDENLLTVQSIYATAASVYEETTFITKQQQAALYGGTIPSLAESKQKEKEKIINSAAATSLSSPAQPSATQNNSRVLPHVSASSSSSPSSPSSIDENALLAHQVTSACASIFRGCYTLVVSGSLSIRRSAAEKLRYPENFYKLRCLMNSFMYGIRSDILAAPSPSYLCKMTMNFLGFMEELLPDTQSGLEASFELLEIYEVFLLVIEDIFSNLTRLLKSRNEHARDPMHSYRRLSRSEENLMSCAVRLCFLLIARINQITVFVGHTDWIVRGNIECRAKALRELVTNNKVFDSALFAFLLYDLETLPSSYDDEIADGDASSDGLVDDGSFAGASAIDSLPTRDSMRIHLLWIFACLFHVTPTLQRDFLHQYHVWQLTLDSGVRPTMIHTLLAQQQQLMCKDRLSHYLTTRKVLAPDEFIVEHAVIDLKSSNRGLTDGNGHRFLLLTNHAYYVSSALDRGVEGWSWLNHKVGWYKREYGDIRHVAVGEGGQAFKITRFAKSCVDRLNPDTSGEMEQIVDVYIVPQLGLVDRLLNALVRLRRDDFGNCMTVERDTLTIRALHSLYSMQLGFKMNPETYSLKMMHLVHVRDADEDDDEDDDDDDIELSALLWVVPESGGEGYLVIADIHHEFMVKPVAEHADAMKRVFSDAEQHNFSSLESVDFPQDTATMQLCFTNSTVCVAFLCDAARQMWRSAIKAQFIPQQDIEGEWKAEILPSSRQAKHVYETKII